MNSEIRILLQFWDFHRLSVNEAWNLLLWVVRDSFEFEKACCVLFPIHVHFMLDHTMLLCGMICVILLPIMLAHVLFMLVMLI